MAWLTGRELPLSFRFHVAVAEALGGGGTYCAGPTRNSPKRRN
jgi:hypothetical protein